MECQFKKSIGKKWSMRFEYSSDILVPCTHPAKFVITWYGKVTKDYYVCGVHKNQIVRQSDLVGIPISVEVI